MKHRKFNNNCIMAKKCWSFVCSILVFGFSTIFLQPSGADAMQLIRDSDLSIIWDNTLKYSAGYRLENQDSNLISDPQSDDGNRNFDTGIISSRFDLLSELDLKYKNVGFRISAAAWYDFIYNDDNDNDSAATSNSFSHRYDEFNDQTEALHGQDGEILDAFAFANFKLGKMPASIRVGKHTLLWGESLLFATNGLSYGQAPLDIIKLLGVPGTQAKELFMPVEQVSMVVRPLSNLSFAGFYQWKWEETRIPAAGSYLSDVDLLDDGGERLIAGPGVSLFRGEDFQAQDSGQWGVAVRYRPQQFDMQFGLYYYVFHDRLPQLYLRPGIVPPPGPPIVLDPTVVDFSIGKVGEYYLVYPENIKVLGASFSTQIGPANVAGEVHMRFDMPLVSTPQLILPGVSADNDDSGLFATGDSLHTNLSAMFFLNPSNLWDGGIVLSEVGYNTYTEINENEAAMDTTRNRSVWGFRIVFEPAYFQVLPGVDLKVPIGLGYNPKGNSVVDQKFNGGADEGGDFSLGLSMDYNAVWRFGIKYTNYFGDTDTQTLEDRDFISCWVQRTF